MRNNVWQWSSLPIIWSNVLVLSDGLNRMDTIWRTRHRHERPGLQPWKPRPCPLTGSSTNPRPLFCLSFCEVSPEAWWTFDNVVILHHSHLLSINRYPSDSQLHGCQKCIEFSYALIFFLTLSQTPSNIRLWILLEVSLLSPSVRREPFFYAAVSQSVWDTYWLWLPCCHCCYWQPTLHKEGFSLHEMHCTMQLLM